MKLVERLVPRVLTSRETVVSPARNGWISVYDDDPDSWFDQDDWLGDA